MCINISTLELVGSIGNIINISTLELVGSIGNIINISCKYGLSNGLS